MLESTALKGLPLSIHHIEFHVSNALLSSYWYCNSFGFQRFAKKEDAHWNSIAIRNGNVVFIFTTCKKQDEDFVKHLTVHGDSVRFLTDDINATIKRIVEQGGFILKPVEVVADDDGPVKTAVIGLPQCDVGHSLLESKTYQGFFLPEYGQYDCNSDILKAMSVDESIFNSSYTAMRIVLIAKKSKAIQIRLAEPILKAIGMHSQIQEFLDYNGGAGVQHIAFLVDDIIQMAERMKQRGIKFVAVPDEYYTDLKARLATSQVNLLENFEKIKQLQILMDFNDHGYLLQMFTQPVQDRPTLLFELIQRNNYSGFGARNVTALYNAVEKQQCKRHYN